jgi:hypothetical protein
VPIGSTQRSELLPTGRWTLVARLADGREQRVELELVSGVVVPVKLTF